MAPGEKAQFFVISTVCHNVVNKSSDSSHGLEEQRLVFKLKKRVMATLQYVIFGYRG